MEDLANLALVLPYFEFDDVAHLAVAILFDDIDAIMHGDKVFQFVRKWESAQAEITGIDATLGLQLMTRLF